MLPGCCDGDSAGTCARQRPEVCARGLKDRASRRTTGAVTHPGIPAPHPARHARSRGAVCGGHDPPCCARGAGLRCRPRFREAAGDRRTVQVSGCRSPTGRRQDGTGGRERDRSVTGSRAARRLPERTLVEWRTHPWRPLGQDRPCRDSDVCRTGRCPNAHGDVRGPGDRRPSGRTTGFRRGAGVGDGHIAFRESPPCRRARRGRIASPCSP